MPLNSEGLIAALAELQDALDGLAAYFAVETRRLVASGGGASPFEVEAMRERAALCVHLSRALGHLIRPSQTP